MTCTAQRLAPAPHRILIRGVNWLGDAVMTTPAIQRLREAYPEAEITLLTHQKLKDIWIAHPHVDEVETFADGEGSGSIARRMKGKGFDLGVALPNSPRTALELWRAGIPRRVGYQAAWRNWMLSHAVPRATDVVHMRKRSNDEIKRLIESPGAGNPPSIPAESHHIHHYLRLMAAIGASPDPVAPRLEIPAESIARFRSEFLPETGDDVVWLGLNPGAEYGPAKRWGFDRFLHVAKEIQKEHNVGWIVFGAPNDIAAKHIAEELPGLSGSPLTVDLAGRTTLAQLCAGLKLCDALLTNDSGPMHVAAALGTPVVVPFGSTSIELTGPGLPGDSTSHKLLTSNEPCAPCFRRDCPIDFRCMDNIPVERVSDAIKAVLAD